MSFRTTYLLFGTLLVCLAFFGFTQYLKRPGSDANEYILPSYHDKKDKRLTADVDTVEVKRNKPKEELITFVKGQQGWQIRDPFKTPVHADGTAIDDLIRQVTNARKEMQADTKQADRAQLGLDAPATVITLKKGDEVLGKVSIGEESPDKRILYVSSSESKEPMAVRRSDLDGAFKKVTDFRSKDLLAISPFNTTQLDVSAVDPKDAKKTLPLSVTQSDNRWSLQKPIVAEADLDGEGEGAKERIGVKGLINAVAGLRVESDADFAKDDAANMAEYGLEDDKPATLKVTATYNRDSRIGGDADKTPTTATLLIGKKADEKGEKYYARLQDEKAVVKVPAKMVATILQTAEKPDALRNRDLLALDVPKVDAIDIKQGKTTIQLRKPADRWKLVDAAGKLVDADTTAVTQLLDNLAAKRAVRDFPTGKPADLGLTAPEADASSISVWEDGIEDKKDEAKAAKLKEGQKPKAKLVFGKENKEKGSVFVLRQAGGQDTALEAPGTLSTWAAKDQLAYLDRKLPSFTAGAETRLVLSRKEGPFELDKEKKDDKSVAVWKFKQPKALAGQAADPGNVDAILRTLRELIPTQWVAEKPTEKQLEEFGLKSPAISATVTLPAAGDKKTEDRIYQFGNLNKDKDGLYARLNYGSEANRVFLVRPEVLDTLRAEVRDRKLFALDSNKVRGLKLSGWKNKYKSFVMSLDLERQIDKPWTIKPGGPKDFKLEDPQVNGFLGEIANLRADSFLPHDPKAAYGFSTDAGGLQIELAIDGDKTPLTLTVGKLQDGKSYVAQSNRLPGEVFLLPQQPLKRLLDDGVDYFTGKAGTVK